MLPDVPPTPPPIVARAVTHEDLARDLEELRRWRGEDYSSLRNIESRMEAHHLAQMEQFGILARAVVKPRLRFSFWGLFK